MSGNCPGKKMGGSPLPPPLFHPGGRCCVPRVPLPNNVNDVRKLSGKKMGGSPPPPPPPRSISFFWELRERLYTFSGLARAQKPRPSPPKFLCFRRQWGGSIYDLRWGGGGGDGVYNHPPPPGFSDEKKKIFGN